MLLLGWRAIDGMLRMDTWYALQGLCRQHVRLLHGTCMDELRGIHSCLATVRCMTSRPWYRQSQNTWLVITHSWYKALAAYI
jgi:hypothetical protein